MKTIPLILGTAVATLLAGCASTTPVALAPVGPGPYAPQTAASDTGSLQVYSAMVTRTEGLENPDWHQHSHYYISDANGPQSRYADNTVGRYDRAPRTVHLIPGTYTVKAKANGGEWVDVPVVIKRGETTIVHLDNAWNPANVLPNEIVSTPNGYAVGWRGDVTPTGRTD